MVIGFGVGCVSGFDVDLGFCFVEGVVGDVDGGGGI